MKRRKRLSDATGVCIDWTYDDSMKKLSICTSVTALLLGSLHPPVSAQLSGKELQIYLYGVYIGYAAAECNAYQKGMIPRSMVLETFTNIGTDKEIDDTHKQLVFQVIQELEDSPKCQALFKEWAGSSN